MNLTTPAVSAYSTTLGSQATASTKKTATATETTPSMAGSSQVAYSSDIISSEAASNTKGKSTMDVNDFLKLLAAQFQFQDPMNPISDTGFIGQMAQMTSLQQMTALSNTMTTTSAVSYIGKEVVISDSSSINPTTGNKDTITGTVTAISIEDGKTLVTVNGNKYSLSDITEVHQTLSTSDQILLQNLLSQQMASTPTTPSSSSTSSTSTPTTTTSTTSS